MTIISSSTGRYSHRVNYRIYNPTEREPWEIHKVCAYQPELPLRARIAHHTAIWQYPRTVARPATKANHHNDVTVHEPDYSSVPRSLDHTKNPSSKSKADVMYCTTCTDLESSNSRKAQNSSGISISWLHGAQAPKLALRLRIPSSRNLMQITVGAAALSAPRLRMRRTGVGDLAGE